MKLYKSMKTKTTLAAIAGLALGFSVETHAAVLVLDSATGLNNSYQSSTITFSFSGLDLTGGDKLVVSIGAQSTGAGTASGERNWNSVTFDSQSMTEAARFGASGDSQFQSGIYYLDNLTGLSATGSLSISASTLNARGASATAWVLSGTAVGHGASGGSLGSSSTSLTTTADGSWLLAHATVAGTTVPLAQSPMTLGLTVTNPYNGSAQTSNGTGYQTVASLGTNLTPTFDIGATTVAAEFTAAAIPEPTTTALLGLGGLALILRRRK
ncbi:MAG: hypothetical protein ACJAR1_002641 [Rubritalea sp.]|jgi:hypothetical protein